MDKIKNVAQRLGIITVEDMERYTALELMLAIANKVNELIDDVERFESDVDEVVKSQNEKIQRLLDEGLLSEVIAVFDGWVQDGTFDTLLNHSALKSVNDRIDETNAQLSELANKGTTVEVLERVTKEEIERQISDGTIANLMIEDGSITEEKLAFKTLTALPSKNLFNKNDVTAGKYVDYRNGVLTSADGYSASNYIEVEANEVYCKNTSAQFAFYDVNKTFISGLNTDRVFTTPSNCCYVRLSVENSALDSLQFEKGSVQTDYVNFNCNFLDINTVPNNSITKEKLAFSTVELEKSKNLFNKETVTTGYYVDYTSGKLLSNASYSASDYIEVESDTIYSKVTSYQFAFYDVNRKFISGLNTDTVFTTPSNCKFIRISVKNESLDSEMVVENADVGSYERFGGLIPKDLLPQEVLNGAMEYTNFVIVSKDNPKLDTINKALYNLKGVDSVDNPCVILVMPGVYEESLIMAYRYISIVGVDKDMCIITNKLNDYYNPPVDLTPNSHLKNLTIIADNDGIVEIPDVGTPGQQSYAVHFDSAGRYYNSKTEGVSRIENCILISNNYQALGSGLCVNQKLICENVEFRAYKNNNAMRIHNYSLEGGYGSSAVFKDCVFISENGKPIHVQNVNNNNTDTEITFINNVAYNNNGQADCLRHEEVLSDGSISGHIKLGHGSYGNSVPELNK